MKKILLILILITILFSCKKQVSPIISGTYVLSTHVVEIVGTSETSFIISVPAYKTAVFRYGSDSHDFFSCQAADAASTFFSGNFHIAVKGLQGSVATVRTHNLRVFFDGSCVDTVKIVQYPPSVENSIKE